MIDDISNKQHHTKDLVSIPREELRKLLEIKEADRATQRKVFLKNMELQYNLWTCTGALPRVEGDPRRKEEG